MKLSDFNYSLPPELIAQYPLEKRDESRLMVVCRRTGGIKHKVFKEVFDLIGPENVLVFNDTKVFKARLFAKRQGFDKSIEILICRRVEGNLYDVLAKPSKKLFSGTKLIFEDKRLKAEVAGRQNGYIQLCFDVKGDLMELLDEIGLTPLPPYIDRRAEKSDESRYQTVYAKNSGAIAAPTAGLHFSHALLDKAAVNGVLSEYLTLHVGYGTFRPVKEEDIVRHKMHTEYFKISPESSSRINNLRQCGKKITAIGTTSCRALEASASVSRLSGRARYYVSAGESETDIFIYPGYEFRITDSLITNFHLPKTTLLMLVCAFAGTENIMNAYKEAIRMKYRFFSYGDAMLIM
jgi:S-adenosylmethionine:tRNA ribosyltransferase-isomerase